MSGIFDYRVDYLAIYIVYICVALREFLTPAFGTVYWSKLRVSPSGLSKFEKVHAFYFGLPQIDKMEFCHEHKS